MATLKNAKFRSLETKYVRTHARVNDVHSESNETVVRRIIRPSTERQLLQVARRAISAQEPIAICGGRNAMGGQQFLSQGLLLDLSDLNQIIQLDSEKGTVEVQAGICWPKLITELHSRQTNVSTPWVIRQKQTGADNLSLGGALSANVHSRGLQMRPFVDDIESFRILGADGRIKKCSREINAGLFQLAVGGYGLFGIVLSITLKLVRQQILARSVAVIERSELLQAFNQAIAEGAVYGDFQFSCDEKSDELLRRGVFSAYKPVEGGTQIPENQDFLNKENWRELIHLAHVDKARAFQCYSQYYLATHGQLYESDRMQLATYLEGYHKEIDKKCAACVKGNEMISEVYVPREQLAQFLEEAAQYIRSARANLIYGTVRLIVQEKETFLRWAKASYACIIFNLHFEQTEQGRREVAEHFRNLFDLGLRRGGSFYLTYHRFASKQQLLSAYPQFPSFLAAKLEHDPKEIFQSNWYQEYRRMFAAEIEELQTLQAPSKKSAGAFL